MSSGPLGLEFNPHFAYSSFWLTVKPSGSGRTMSWNRGSACRVLGKWGLITIWSLYNPGFDAGLRWDARRHHFCLPFLWTSFLGAARSWRESGLGTAGFHLYLLQMMLFCWFHQTRTFRVSP